MFVLDETTAQGPVLTLVNALREVLTGKREFHEKQSWYFDPTVAKRRNPEYEAVNGHRSVNLIERFGLGEDGRQEERRREQAIRDIGIPITGRR